MADNIRVTGQPCGIENCRSRKYEQAEDGYLYCQNGHRQGNLVRGVDDEDNFGTATRTVTRKKKEVDESTKKKKDGLNKQQTFGVYLKSLQLILRHQILFLIQERGLPTELETIVFDLWALRIAQLSDKIDTVDPEDDDSQSQKKVFSSLNSEASETSDNEGPSRSGKTEGRVRRLWQTPNLKDCLALCYLGILTLRIPITPGDMYAWIADDKLPYRRAIRLLPLSMKDLLPATYHVVLEPKPLLIYRSFYDTVTDLQIGFGKTYGISWPALNAPLLLFRYLKELALPLELYTTTLRLAEFIKCDFMLHYENHKRLGLRHLPEAQLIGCLIICVKLLYPFGDEQRYPRAITEPTATKLDWKEWCIEMRTTHAKPNSDEGGFTTEELTRVNEDDVFSMSKDQIDQYLDFYSQTFLDEAELQRTRDNNAFQHALYEMFPIDGSGAQKPFQMSNDVSHQERLDVVKAVHNTMSPVPIAPEDDEAQLLRPGEMYPSWRKERELPEHAKQFYEAVARLAGFSVDMLVRAVFLTEARVERWRREQRKLAQEQQASET